MHRFSIVILSGAFFATVIHSPAKAQPPILVQQFAKWDAAAPMPPPDQIILQIRAAAQRIYASDGGCILDDIRIVSTNPATAERYVFNGILSKSVRNGWHITVRHNKCDVAEVRYLITQDSSGNLDTIRVNRGVSFAHDSLIGDAYPMATLAAHSVLRVAKVKCDETSEKELGVVRIEHQSDDLGSAAYGVRYKGSWTEIWPIKMCNRTVEMPVQFTADGDGGAYFSAKGSAAKLLP